MDNQFPAIDGESVGTEPRPSAPESVVVESELRADREEVWAAVSTMRGVNRELPRFVRMTDPTRGAQFESAPWQTPGLASWILLLGVFPINRHRFGFEQITHGSYRETSTSRLYAWRHQREVIDRDDGACIVRDTLEITPRVRLLSSILRRSIRWALRNRHTRLKRRFAAG